jgi:hypothetical protein
MKKDEEIYKMSSSGPIYSLGESQKEKRKRKYQKACSGK